MALVCAAADAAARTADGCISVGGNRVAGGRGPIGGGLVATWWRRRPAKSRVSALMRKRLALKSKARMTPGRSHQRGVRRPRHPERGRRMRVSAAA